MFHLLSALADKIVQTSYGSCHFTYIYLDTRKEELVRSQEGRSDPWLKQRNRKIEAWMYSGNENFLTGI